MFKGEFAPEILPGSFWIIKECYFKESATDIYAKVLKVTEDRVFIARKSQFGFEDLPPASMKINEFLILFNALEE